MQEADRNARPRASKTGRSPRTALAVTEGSQFGVSQAASGADAPIPRDHDLRRPSFRRVVYRYPEACPKPLGRGWILARWGLVAMAERVSLVSLLHAVSRWVNRSVIPRFPATRCLTVALAVSGYPMPGMG